MAYYIMWKALYITDVIWDGTGIALATTGEKPETGLESYKDAEWLVRNICLQASKGQSDEWRKHGYEIVEHE